jgi:hypothetical protein
MVIDSRTLRSVGYVACMRGTRNVDSILAGKPEEGRPFWIILGKCKDSNIKTNLEETEWEWYILDLCDPG